MAAFFAGQAQMGVGWQQVCAGRQPAYMLLVPLLGRLSRWLCWKGPCHKGGVCRFARWHLLCADANAQSSELLLAVIFAACSSIATFFADCARLVVGACHSNSAQDMPVQHTALPCRAEVSAS